MTLYRRLLQAVIAPSRVLDVIIGAVGAILCVAMTGYFKINLIQPGYIGGDHTFYLTITKSYINGHGFRFDSQLGFPSARDFIYFPNSDLTQRIGLWLAAHVTTNPFLAMHAVYIAALIAMDAFTYWMLRRVGINPLLAVLGGLAAVITHFMVARAFNHDALAMYYSVPLALGLAFSIGLSPADARLGRFVRDPFVITAVLVIGASGLYYAFYTMMLAAFVGLAAAVGQRRWFPVLAAACVAIPIPLLVVFSAIGLDLPAALLVKDTAPVRGAYEQLLFGLDLPALAFSLSFVPKVAAGVAQSLQAAPTAFTNEGAGEWPSLPLAAILMASPLIVAFSYYWRRDRGERRHAYPDLIGLCAILIVFIILFGARGGLAFIFNLLVSPQIRADARLMPFLVTAAVVIACALGEWARHARPLLVRYGGPLVAGLVLLASTHQGTGGLKAKQSTDLADPNKQALIHSVQMLLKAKDDGHLKTVLQLPLASWPEVGLIHGFDPYLHELPYLYDKAGNSTRWSYGANDRQPGGALVNFALSDPATVLDRARSYGFDSILIVKSAYEPAQLNTLEGAVGGRLASACRLYDDGVQVLYAIKRDAHGAPC